MSQIEKKNQEFVKTNSHVLEDTSNQEFGYWKSLKDISSEDDYNRFLKQSEHNVDNGLSRRNFLSLIAASVALAGLEGCKSLFKKSSLMLKLKLVQFLVFQNTMQVLYLLKIML